MNRIVTLLGSMWVFLGLFGPSVQAQSDGGTWVLRHQSPETLQVTLFKSRIIELRVPVKKISVGNPSIADILILRAQQIYVVGKALGTTNVVLWDSSDRVVATIDLEVTHDLETLKARVYELLPGENIKIHSSQGALVLSGEVSSVEKMDAAIQLATSFLPAGQRGEKEKVGTSSKVINLMQIGGAHQVMLEVKVAEMNRTLTKAFDIDFVSLLNTGSWALGATGVGRAVASGAPLGLSADPLNITDMGLFANFQSNDFLFNSVLNAAKKNGLARILAEPTLTTLTGQEAAFVSGGEFPIPVPSGDQGITIEFKEFGIGLKFLPVILDSGRISLKVNVSVSELTNANSVVIDVQEASADFFVPALTKRSATSTVELSDGQTLGIAGLISEALRESITRFPGLGDIPVLGLLFRSQEYVKGQTELVIFVTPHFARPTPPGMVRLPTDDFVEPNDTDFYLMGRLEGRRDTATDSETAGLGAEGTFGHVIYGE